MSRSGLRRHGSTDAGRLTAYQPDSLSSARETELFELAVRQLCAGSQVQAFAGRYSGASGS